MPNPDDFSSCISQSRRSLVEERNELREVLSALIAASNEVTRCLDSHDPHGQVDIHGTKARYSKSSCEIDHELIAKLKEAADAASRV